MLFHTLKFILNFLIGGQVRPSGAAAAPLRPRFLVQRDQGAPRAVPWTFSAHGGAAGHEQRGVEQHESPRGQLRAWAVVGQMRPSGAAVSPL